MMPAPPCMDDYRRPPSPDAREGGNRQPPEGSPDQPLVSIVTVVFNGERTLQATIDSVAAQDYPAIEYIVLDGGSTDRTLDVLARNERHITYWRSEPDQGIYDAMNKGVALARGQLIKLLNADDILTAGSVHLAVEAYQREGAGAVIKSDMELIDEQGAFVKVIEARRAMNPFGGVVHPSWYVDRAVYQHHGLYHTSFRVSADYELFARLHTRGVPFVQIPLPLVQFRAGGASSGLTGLTERFRANRAYLGLPHAVRLFLRQGYVKTRGQLLRRVFSEQQLAALQRRVRPGARPRAEGEP